MYRTVRRQVSLRFLRTGTEGPQPVGPRVDEEAGLRAGTATEIGARVGVAPASLGEELPPPTWTTSGAFVPFKGENGS